MMKAKCAVCGKPIDLKRESWARDIDGPFVNHPILDPDPYLVSGPVMHMRCAEKDDA